MVAERVSPERLVFVDEMGVRTSLALLYGYSGKGERLYLQAPRNRGENTTLVASISLEEGVGESMDVERSTTKEVFEAYLEAFLALHCAPGDCGDGQPRRSHPQEGERAERKAGSRARPSGISTRRLNYPDTNRFNVKFRD